jgi:hypothetical protein
MTTLGDLKRAIDEVPDAPLLGVLMTKVNRDDLNSFVALRNEYHKRLASAWRTAFEWRTNLSMRHAALLQSEGHITSFIALDREEEEGMTLIREKLK